MHNKLPSSIPELTEERQWEAASWIATLNVMKDLSDQSKREKLEPGMERFIGSRLMGLGSIYNNDPAAFVPMLTTWRQKWTAIQDTSLPPSISVIKFFQPNGEIDNALQSAHLLGCSQDEVSREIAHEADFQRLEPYIIDCHDYNMQQVEQAYEQEQVQYEADLEYGRRPCRFAHALQKIRHDSNFYIGMWDQPDSDAVA